VSFQVNGASEKELLTKRKGVAVHNLIVIINEKEASNMNTRKIIRLNIFPITPEKFRFELWRQEYQGRNTKDSFEGLHRYRLPIKEDQDEYNDYWISFEPMEKLEKFVCKENYNHFLTKHYLHHLLVRRIENSLSGGDYEVQEGYRKLVYFVLRRHKEGREVVWLEPYYLKSVSKFGFLIDFRFLTAPDIPYSRYIQQLTLSLDANFRSNRNYYIDKYQKIQEFLCRFKDNISPITLTNNTQLHISTDFQDLSTEMLQTKRYVFGNEGTYASQYKGIENYGPLEGVYRGVILAYIYQNRDNYLLEDLKRALNGSAYDVMFSGLESFFRLHIQGEEEISISDFSQDALLDAKNRIINILDNSNDFLVMPIMIGDKNDEKSYYFLKYNLLKENLPLQVVTRQLLGKRESIKWAASGIALQIFAKLGGKAWKVVPSHEKSIIFGIGQSHEKIDKKIVKYFAYSVCTDSSGIYKKVNILGISEDKETYLKQLRVKIIETVKEHLGEGYTKYVLHIPFKIKRDEIEAINNAIEGLKTDERFSDIDFIVLKINTDNDKFFGYAYTNSLVPYESTYTKLSNNPPSYLVWFEGLQYHRELIHKRISEPVLIDFYWNSKELTEDERINYLQDVLNLSGANWRGFNAKSLPISIYYCKLIARFLKGFPKEIDNIENIFSPWFL
jgi:hypothetical protein